MLRIKSTILINDRRSHVLFKTYTSLRIRRGVSMSKNELDLMTSPSPSSYVDPHKDLSHEQKIAHSLVPPGDILMTSYLSDNDVKLVYQPNTSAVR